VGLLRQSGASDTALALLPAILFRIAQHQLLIPRSLFVGRHKLLLPVLDIPGLNPVRGHVILPKPYSPPSIGSFISHSTSYDKGKGKVDRVVNQVPRREEAFIA